MTDRQKASSRLLKIPYKGRRDDKIGLEFMNIEAGHTRTNNGKSDRDHLSRLDLTNPLHYEACTWLQFPLGASWVPESIEVNGRKGRRVVCVLAQDRVHYRIFDLDSHSIPAVPVDMTID